MRAKFKVLSGERLCEKAFGVNLGEFDSSKSAFASDKGYKSTLACEFNGLKNALASKVKNLKSAFVSDKSYKSTLASEFKGSKNALASKFDGSKGVFVGDESHKNEFKNLKSTLASEFNGLKSVLASKITNKAKNSKNAFVGEFDSHENAVASQKGALMSAFKTHLSELKRAFASLCERTKFKNERVKKNFGVGISLSLSLSR